VKLRSIVGTSIIVAWAGVAGLHVRREYFIAESARLEAGARTLAPGTHFFVVRMNGRAIGTATTRLDTVADTLRFNDQLLLDVPAMDTVHRAMTSTRIDMSRGLQMRGFAFRLASKIGDFAAQGTVQPDSTLVIRVQAGGTEQSSTIPANGVLLEGAVTLRMAAAGRLRVGEELTVRTFDPSAMAVRASLIRVTATDTLILPDSARVASGNRWEAAVWDTIPVWRIEQTVGGIAMASWVDEDGMMVRAESPLGFEIERTTFELARQEWLAASTDAGRSAGFGALIETTAIASNADLSDIAARDRLTVRLIGVDLTGFDLAGGRQSMRGDTLTVAREDFDAFRNAGYTLPYRGTGEPLAETGPTPLIQSDDERIIRAARDAVNRTRDPAAAARRLNQYVYTLLKKEITPSVPSALQVLEARRGDCNEHTVLYVALARALGMPARTAVGLVHVNGRFYYHAWPEVWLADSWVAVDPTLGQFPADASHLRFIVGGLARQVELIRLIGRLEIDVQ